MSKRCLSLCCAAIVLGLLLAGCVTLDFSPDGKQIVFTWSTQANREGLFIAHTDGTGLHALPDIDDAETALWSPDGHSILIADQYWEQSQNQEVQREKLKIYDMRSDQTRTIADRTGGPFAWNADGSRFVATGSPSENHPDLRWFQMPEGRLISTTPLPSIQSISNIIWLPGTDDLAFIGATDRSVNVYRVQTGHVQRITTTGDVIGMGLSADKQRMLWARAENFNPSTLRLFSYDLASHAVAKLPFALHLPPIPSAQPLTTPDFIYVEFSPDAQRLLLFMSSIPLHDKRKHRKATSSPSAVQAVYALRIDGSDVRLLQTGLAQKSEYPIPFWSRDGKRLAIYRTGDPSSAIYLYNADGSGKYRIPLPAWPQTPVKKAAAAHETRQTRHR